MYGGHGVNQGTDIVCSHRYVKKLRQLSDTPAASKTTSKNDIGVDGIQRVVSQKGIKLSGQLQFLASDDTDGRSGLECLPGLVVGYGQRIFDPHWLAGGKHLTGIDGGGQVPLVVAVDDKVEGVP